MKKYSNQVRGKNRYQSNYNIKHTKASRHPMLPGSQDWKVILPKKTKWKSQKVAICKTRMSINFKKLCAHMYVTTKCYIGQMLEVCLETTEAKTRKHQGWEQIPREPAGCVQSGPKEREPPLKRYHVTLYKKRKSRTGTNGGETPSFWLKNVLHLH